MNVYGKKGALVFALYSAFCAVTLLVPFGKAVAGICFAAVTLSLVLYLILSKRKASAIFMCVLCLVSSSLGFLSGYTYMNKISSAQKFADENEHTICAEITYSVYEKQFGSLYYAKLSSIDGEKVYSFVEVAFPYLPDIALHDKIKATVLLSEPDGDEASLLKSKGVFLCAEIKSFSITESGGNGTIVAVGTTSVRTLESLYYAGVSCLEGGEPQDVGQWDPYEREFSYSTLESLRAIDSYLEASGLEELKLGTRIIIVPGFNFRLVDAIVTNFHQPQSTLLLLISAFVNGDWHSIYDHALANDYRFLSYGDSSLLFKG